MFTNFSGSKISPSKSKSKESGEDERDAHDEANVEKCEQKQQESSMQPHNPPAESDELKSQRRRECFRAYKPLFPTSKLVLQPFRTFLCYILSNFNQ